MRVLLVTNTAVDLANQTHPFVQGADVLAYATSALQLQGSNDNSNWSSIGGALTANVFAERPLSYRYVRCSTAATIQLLSN